MKGGNILWIPSNLPCCRAPHPPACSIIHIHASLLANQSFHPHTHTHHTHPPPPPPPSDLSLTGPTSPIPIPAPLKFSDPTNESVLGIYSAGTLPKMKTLALFPEPNSQSKILSITSI